MLRENNNWITQKHCFGRQIVLKPWFQQMDCPLLKAELMPHQKLSLKAMCDLEQLREIGIGDYSVYTNYGVYSDKYGSGKTFVLMALLCSKPPKKLPELTPHVGYPYNYQKYIYYDLNVKTNILLVGTSVLKQWKEHLSNYTNLKVRTISGYRDFKKFYVELKKSRKILNKYDVLLIKNGNMSSKNFHNDFSEINDTPLNQRQIKSIISVIFEVSMFWNIKWRRVILDDFDVIKVHANTQTIPAEFTWFVSASQKASIGKIPKRDNKSIMNSVKYSRPTYLSATNDIILSSTFNIRNEYEYVDECIGICPPLGIKYKAINPNKKSVKLIEALIGDIGQIMDMLNSGAVKSASQKIGIIANSEEEIFKKLLDKSYAKYNKVCNKLKFLEDMRDCLSKYELSEEKLNVKDFNEMIKVNHIPDVRYKNIEKLIDKKVKQLSETKHKLGAPIDRVLENIKHGSCPICLGKISDYQNEDYIDDEEDKEEALIMKCCHVIICQKCLMGGARLKKSNKDISGTCPNCRAVISYTDTIYLSKDLGIEQLLDDDFDISSLFKPIEKEKDEKTPEEKSYTKLDILTSIILNDGRYKGEPFDIQFKSLLGGIGKLPDFDRSKIAKTVIFSKFDESLDKIKTHLADLGLECRILRGTHQKMNKVVEDFRKNIDILLINGEKYCAGLNLEFADRLIFMHRFTLDGKLLDSSVEEQIAGRLQRLGRKTRMEINYIAYDDEVNI